MEAPVLSAQIDTIEVTAGTLPGEFAGPRVLRRLLVLAAVLAGAVALVSLLPGLDSVRDAFAGARWEWLVLAAGLEVLSCLSYVLVFRAVFCQRMPWRASYEIGAAELATNSVVSVGGAGGLALGAWILRRGGMPAALIARRTVAFFLITSLASVTALVVAGIGLGTGALHGAPDRALGWAPAALGLAAVLVVLAIPPAARFLARRIGHTPAEKALRALAAGVEEALALLRSRDAAVIAGAAGYMLFDVAMLGVCFAAFGLAVPPAGVLLMAYLIGQLGGLIPLPGGLAGVDGGLIGTLVLYGAGATAAATAVLAYRAIVLLLPLALGVPALRQVRRRLQADAPRADRCDAGRARGGRLGGLAVETD
jgi:uncharacterized membrane protein YbhN (UPF0104 family)